MLIAFVNFYQFFGVPFLQVANILLSERFKRKKDVSQEAEGKLV